MTEQQPPPEGQAPGAPGPEQLPGHPVAQPQPQPHQAQPQPHQAQPQQPAYPAQQPAAQQPVPHQQPVATAPAATATATGGGFPLKWPVGRVWLWSIVSYGLYSYFWFFTTRKELDQQFGDGRDDAVLHTVLLLVPIANLIVIYWLWRDINDLRARRGLDGFSVILYLLISLIPFVIIFTYTSVLGKLNEYWETATGGQATERPMMKTTPEKVLVGVGVLFWLMWLFFMVLWVILIIVSVGTSSSVVLPSL